MKNWLIWKDPDGGKDWGQEEKGTTEDEMVGWHHWLDGREFEQAPGFGDGRGSLVCCSPWGHKELDTTERLNWEAKCNQYKHKKKWLAHVTWKSKRVVLISGTAGPKGSNAIIYIFSFLGSWLPFSASADKDMLHITAKMTTSGSRCTSSFTVLELRRDTLYFLVSE